MRTLLIPLLALITGFPSLADDDEDSYRKRRSQKPQRPGYHRYCSTRHQDGRHHRYSRHRPCPHWEYRREVREYDPEPEYYPEPVVVYPHPRPLPPPHPVGIVFTFGF